MKPPDLALTDSPDADAIALISDGLDQFNVQVTGIEDRRPIAVLVKDPETQETLGGVTGRTSLGVLFIDVFYLPDALRGSGIGSAILSMVEEEGRRRGCKTAVLYTISFQAPNFYSRYGWNVFGEIECDPPGTSRIFMRKELV